MAEHPTLPGSIALGGVGSNGTRVVAQMLIELGYYMSRDLNRAQDNLLLTLLLFSSSRQWLSGKR